MPHRSRHQWGQWRDVSEVVFAERTAIPAAPRVVFVSLCLRWSTGNVHPIRRHRAVNRGRESAAWAVKRWTQRVGIDTAIEAVGISAIFFIGQEIVAPGCVIASVGACTPASSTCILKRSWLQDISITTRLIDPQTTSMLLKTVAPKGVIQCNEVATAMGSSSDNRTPSDQFQVGWPRARWPGANCRASA